MQLILLEHRDPLLERRRIKIPDIGDAGFHGADFLASVLDREHGELAIGAVAQRLDGAGECEQPRQGRAVGADLEERARVGLRIAQRKGQSMRIGSPGWVGGPAATGLAAG